MSVRCVRGGGSLLSGWKAAANGMLLGAALVLTGCAILSSDARAKTPGTIHCYGGWCHRVSTIDEMHAMVGQRGYLRTSYYDDCRVDRFNACGLTSSGEVFRPDQADNAASPIFPDGTILLAYNPENGSAAVLRVNSTGPYRGDRRLDVSRATAEKLGFKKKGVADLAVTVIRSPEPEDARYKKRRSYAPVPGFIGKFKSFDAAHDAALASLKMQLNTQTAALDSGLDPSLFPPDYRVALASLPRISVAAVPVREIVFSAPPDGSARASPIMSVAPIAAHEELSQPPDAVLNGGVIAGETTNSVGIDVVAAIDHAGYSDPAAPQEIGSVRTSEAGLKRSVKVSALFDGRLLTRLTAFFEAAQAEARLKGVKREQLAAHAQFSWGDRISAFVRQAQAKARASVAQDGAMQRFTAELTLKARRYR